MKIASLALLLLAFSSTGQAAMLITPAGNPPSGIATGSGFVQFGGMFDAQPTGIPTVGTTTAGYGSTYDYTGTGGIGRVGFIDFGAGYANITLQQTYVELKQFGTASTAGVSYFFSADKTLDAGDTATVNLGLFSTGTADSNQQWINTFSGSVPVTQEYLLVRYDSGDVGNRLAEVAFAGTNGVAVPEPSTWVLPSLLGIAGLVIMRHRRSLTRPATLS